MNTRKSKMRLTEAELADKVREEQERLKGLERAGAIELGGKVSEEFWKLPRLNDPEGLLLKVLLDDREQGR